MTNQYKNIIVAVDGSKEGEYAFRKSIEFAKRDPDTTIHITNIIDNRFPLERSVAEQIRQQSIDLIEYYQRQAKEEGINRINLISQYGSPRSAISGEVAEEVQADLIICGATGHNVVERFLIGSVSEAIVRTATCDVLVIRTEKQT